MAHNTKRAMAHKRANKERKARQHGQRNLRSSGQSTSRKKTQKNGHRGHSRRSGIYDEADALDRQLFDYIIVIDVEATCDKDSVNYPHEIIEFPGVLIDVRRGVVDKNRSFHSYVRPLRNPVLTEFCKTLTGISQKDVDNAPTMQEVVKAFVQWFCDTIPVGAKVVFAADGPWDFKKFIYEYSILRDKVSFPSIFYEYLDIRTTFAHHFHRGTSIKLDAMLRQMGLKFEGRPHCGFDDATNIARLALAMMKAGYIFDFLVAIPIEDSYYYKLEGYPLYRREEGSGRLDSDVVDDIAKKSFGIEYFNFGEQHREAVLEYRRKHPDEFSGVALRKMEAILNRDRLSIRCRLVALCVLIILATVMLLILVFSKVSMWWKAL